MRKVIYTKQAPEPIGPYSQAVKAGNTLYISGQIAIDSAIGNLLTESIEQETEAVMKNLENLLKEAGYQFSDVVKTTIFLSSMEHFTKVNDIYGRYFHSYFPARETVAVASLPKNVNVEISMIAYKN